MAVKKKKAAKKILVTTAEKKAQERFTAGFARGEIEGRKKAFDEIISLLGIDELIRQKVQDAIWDHENDKHDLYSGCPCCGR